MKIFKSFGEFATVFLLLVVVVLGLMFWIINNGSSARYKSLTNNAIRFSDVVGLNLSSFPNERLVFLEQVIDGGYMSNIKSPFSTNNCDSIKSYVEIDSARKKVTLTCDKYVLKNYRAGDTDIEVYEVGEWRDTKKNDSDEETTLYNCIDLNGNNVFEDYYEDKYFLYELNKKYNTYYYDVSSINNSNCKVDSKIVYRTVKRISVK